MSNKLELTDIEASHGNNKRERLKTTQQEHNSLHLDVELAIMEKADKNTILKNSIVQLNDPGLENLLSASL